MFIRFSSTEAALLLDGLVFSKYTLDWITSSEWSTSYVFQSLYLRDKSSCSKGILCVVSIDVCLEQSINFLRNIWLFILTNKPVKIWQFFLSFYFVLFFFFRSDTIIATWANVKNKSEYLYTLEVWVYPHILHGSFSNSRSKQAKSSFIKSTEKQYRKY